MNRLIYAAALIAVALQSVVFAGTNQTYDEYAKEKCAQQGLTPEECMLTRPDDPAEGLEPPMHEWPEDDQPIQWPEGVPVALAGYDRPFVRYACMSEGWVCPRHVGVWGRDEDRADASGTATNGTPDNSGVGRSVSAPPSAAVDRPSRDRDTDRGRGRGRGRGNPCKD